MYTCSGCTWLRILRNLARHASYPCAGCCSRVVSVEAPHDLLEIVPHPAIFSIRPGLYISVVNIGPLRPPPQRAQRCLPTHQAPRAPNMAGQQSEPNSAAMTRPWNKRLRSTDKVTGVHRPDRPEPHEIIESRDAQSFLLTPTCPSQPGPHVRRGLECERTQGDREQ